MKRKNTLALIAFAMGLLLNLNQINAQVSVGAGTDETKSIPIEAYYGYTYSQSIYLQPEINSSGTITSLAWYFSGTSTLTNTQDIIVWMGHTSNTAFASSTSWIDTTSLTRVYTGTLGTPSGVGWITITLDQPFAYNNIDNLVIAVDENTPSYDASTDDFYCSATSNIQSIWYRSDGTNPDPGAPPSATGTVASIPNIILGGLVAASPPNCDAVMSSPSNGATNVLETTSITWSPASGSPSGYKIQIGTSTGGSQFLAQTDIGASTSYTPGSAFAYNTTYYVNITPYNANGDATGCTEYTFTTRADPTVIAPFFDDFESHSTTTNATFSVNNWTANPSGTTSLFRWNIDGSGSTPSSNTGPNGAYSGNNYLYVEASSGSTGAIAELTSPPIDVSGLSVPRLKFYYHMYGASTGALYVDVFDGTWDLGAITISGQQQTSGADPWNQSTLDLSTYNSTVSIRFRAEKGSSFDGDISLDDVEVEETPSCVAPTSFSTSFISSSEAILNWIAGGSETSWEVSYGPSGFTAGAGTQAFVNNPNDTLSGLSPATAYDFYARAICGPGDTSGWGGPGSFTTLIQGPVGFSCLTGSNTAVFSEEFDAIGGWTGDVASTSTNGDWVFGFSGTTGSSNTGPSGAHSGSNYVYYEASSGTTASMVSPAISLNDANNFAELSFWMHAYGATMGTLDVGVGTSASGPFTNVFNWSGQYQSSSADPWVNVGVNLDAYVGQTIYLEFFFTKGSSFDGDMAIDLVEVNTCISCPTPSNLMESNPTASTVDLGWTENGTSTNWEYSIGSSGFTAGLGTQGITSSNPTTISGLTPLSNYDVYVRSICGPGDTSGWSTAHSFFFAGAPLSGTYTINAGSATGGTNFNSFADFSAALNAAGIGGNVTVNVDSAAGPYNEQVLFGPVVGANASNRITINGNGAVISYSPLSTDKRIVGFDGAKHYTLDNLTITTANSLYGYGIHFMNASDSNVVQNCTIDLGNITSTSSTNSAGIVSSNSITSTLTDGDNGSDLAILNNQIIGGASGGPYNGIYLNGDGIASPVQNHVVMNNYISDFYYYGIYLDDVSDAIIRGNDLERPTRTSVSSFYGIYLSSGTSENNVLDNNAMHNAFGGDLSPTSVIYGIYNTADASAGNENTFYNNLIYDMVNTSTIYGIYHSGADSSRYYHNSISLDDIGASTSSATYGFYTSSSASSGVEFQNNIISITRGGTGTKYGIYVGSATSTIVSDYNGLYVNAASGTNNYGYFSGAQATFLNWQAANSNAYDQNSVETSPGFLGTTDLTPTASDLDSAGTTGLGITLDYNGTSRTTPPDIGAIEFTPPACAPVSAITADSLSSNFARISWTPGGGQLSWNLEYGPSGFTQGSGTTVTGITSQPYDITGLSSTTSYDVYVQSACEGKGNTSPWVGPLTFTTSISGPVGFSCITGNTATVLSEEFDAQGGWTGDIGTGSTARMWNYNSGTTGSGSTGPSGAHSGSNYIYYEASSGTPTEAELISPAIDLSNANDYAELSFWLHAYGSSMPTLRIGASTSASGPWDTLFTWGNQIQTAEADPWTNVGINLDAYVGQTIYLRFHATHGSNFYGDMSIDLLEVSTCLSCVNPGSLTTTNVLSNSADLSWTQGLSETEWELSYGTSGFTAGAGTQVIKSVTNHSLSGLTADTDYDWYVRSICGPGDTSGWSGPASFYTGYCTPAPSSTDGSGITNVSFSTVNNTTGSEPGFYGDYSAQIGEVWQGYTVPVDITFQTGYTYATKIWIDWNNDLDFDDAGEEVYSGTSTSANPTTLNASFAVGPAQATGQYRMRIGGADVGPPTPCYTGTYAAFEDYTIEVVPEPLCESPLNLRAQFLSDTSARLRWDKIDGAIAYKIRWKVAGAPNFGPPVFRNTNTPFWDVSGLTANTRYVYVVAANCNAGWGLPSVERFTTLDAPCYVPSNIQTLQIHADKAKFTWDTVSGAVKYRVRYRAVGSPTWTVLPITAPRNLYWASSLSPSTNYEWQVKTVCEYGPISSGTVWSSMQNFTTLAGPGAPPPSSRIKQYGSIDEVIDRLDLYPNPNNGEFNLEIESQFGMDYRIEIVSITGQLVYSNQIKSEQNYFALPINIENKTPGVYLFKLVGNEGIMTRRIVVQ